MKTFALLAAIVLLTACSSAEPAPETAPLPLPEDTAAASTAPASAAPAAEPNLSSDPLLAAESKDDALLATPVPDSGTVKVNPEPKAEPKAEALSSPTPSSTPPAAAAATSEPAPVPRLSENHEVPPTPVMPTAKADIRKRDSYEEYKEYQKKEESRRDVQDAYDDRAQFPHEGGSWQIGLDYARNAFPDHDFDPSLGVKHADTMGGVLSVGYFPLHSLSFGRFGLLGNYSVYWSKYEFVTTNNVTDSSKVHSIDSFGGKAVYEFDYFLGQIVVPWVFYGMDKVTVRPYSLASGGVVYANYPKSTFNRRAYGGGLNLNLNRLEPMSASRGLANVGVRKTYLAYTYLTDATGGTGASHFLGLRFEY